MQQRLFAVHGALAAIAIGFAAHEAVWAQFVALPVCALLNLLFWLGVTRRFVRAPQEGKALLRAPLLLLLPACYFAGLAVWFAHRTQSPLALVLLPALACVLLFVTTAFVYAHRKSARSLLASLAVVGAILCLEGLAHEWVKTHGFADLAVYSPFRRDVDEAHITRLTFPITYPNALASVLTLFTACSLGAFAGAKSWQERIGWGVVLALNFGCILLTASRGGLITIGFLPLAYLAREHKFGRWVAGVGATLVVAAVLWMLRKPFTRLRGSGSLRQRAHGWIVTLRITARSPLFGEGPGAFSREWYYYGPQHGYANQFGMDGYYANLLCEGGLVSLTMLSLLVVAAGRETWRLLNLRLSKSLQDTVYYIAIGLAAVLLHNLIETTLAMSAILLMTALLFGLLTALRAQEPRSTPPDEDENEPRVKWEGSSYRSAPRRPAKQG